MRLRARIKNGNVVFDHPRAKGVFMRAAEGKDVQVLLDEKASENMRRFFEGALVQAMFYLHPHAGWENFKDAREALKLEYRPGWTTNFKGERIKYARSMTDISKKELTSMVEEIVNYVHTNFAVDLDPEDYVRWRDSVPAAGEMYPPMQRLKEKWEAERSTKPIHRRSIDKDLTEDYTKK